MSIQEAIALGEVTPDELNECLGATEINAHDDTVLDEYDGVQRMIKAESEALERFFLIRIDDLERRLSRVMTMLEGMQTF